MARLLATSSSLHSFLHAHAGIDGPNFPYPLEAQNCQRLPLPQQRRPGCLSCSISHRICTRFGVLCVMFIHIRKISLVPGDTPCILYVKLPGTKPQQNTTKYEPCAYFSGCTACHGCRYPISSSALVPFPDSKVHEAYMWPTWGRQDPGGTHDGPMNLAIRLVITNIVK